MSEKEPQFWLDDDPSPLPNLKSVTPGQQRSSGRYNAPVSRGRTVDSIAPRRPVVTPSQPIQSMPKQPAPENVIHVKLSVPKMPYYLRPATYVTFVKKLILSKKFRAVATVAVIVVIGLTAKNTFMKSKDASNGQTAQSSAQIAQSAGINPLLPAGKTSPDQTKTLDSVYDKSKQIYAYADSYNGANFTVSQQKLPDTVKKDDSVFKKAAQAINAKHQLETTKGTVYLATDAKQNTQMAVLQTDTQLVFIKSSTTLEDYFWVKYIDNLKFAS